MPVLIHRNPKYRKHRATGQAMVTLNGRDIYLGPYGTKASRAEYDRLIGEWLAGGRSLAKATDDLFVVELMEQYFKFAQAWYVGAAGRGDLGGIVTALRPLKRLHKETLAGNFGPLALKALRNEYIATGWSRTYVNRQIGRIVRMFRWGVENEKVLPSVLHALEAVEGLRKGKTEAHESEPVKPAAEAIIEPIKPYVSRQVWAMVQLQIITGMRPGEVTIMRRRDIDTSGKLWLYVPLSHKTEHHGHARTIYLGPKAQEILSPFLKPELDAYLFSPIDAEADRRQKLHQQRKTPASCGNIPGSNRKRKPRRSPGDHYGVDQYGRAIDRACELAFPPPADLARARVPASGRKGRTTRRESEKEWKTRLGDRWAELVKWRTMHRFHPHQLRHTAGTRLRKEFGLEAAQVILGHATLTVTQIYAEKNVEAAQRIMGQVG